MGAMQLSTVVAILVPCNLSMHRAPAVVSIDLHGGSGQVAAIPRSVTHKNPSVMGPAWTVGVANNYVVHSKVFVQQSIESCLPELHRRTFLMQWRKLGWQTAYWYPKAPTTGEDSDLLANGRPNTWHVAAPIN